MYSLSIPVSAIRTKIRQNFERHRYVNQLNAVDVLLFRSDAEYQVLQNPISLRSSSNRGPIHRFLSLLVSAGNTASGTTQSDALPLT
jgi:hypothetical protein